MSSDKGYKWNRTSKGMYAKIKNRAKTYGVPFALSFSKFEELRRLNCRYCNNALPLVGYGVDRLVNHIGYTDANSVPCCKVCNIAKGARSEEDFLAQIDAIYNNIVIKLKKC